MYNAMNHLFTGKEESIRIHSNKFKRKNKCLPCLQLVNWTDRIFKLTCLKLAAIYCYKMKYCITCYAILEVP